MKIAIIDNFDSFTYNLVHYIEEETDNFEVIRYDNLLISEIQNYDAILISPGPGHPDEYNLIYDLIDTYHKTKHILGVCLGHQIIGKYFGSILYNMNKVIHGEKLSTKIINANSVIFKDIPETFFSGRYHSWIIKNIPDCLDITAIDKDFGYTMAISHKNYNIHGVQFHPESIMTDFGKKIIKNWLKSIN